MEELEEPMFDIFTGNNDKDAVWVEAASVLSGARERMEQIAAEHPGQYFVFSQRTHCILARIDSRKPVSPAQIDRTARTA